MKPAILATALLLTACAAKPLPRVEVQKVYYPVPTPCLKPDEIPQRPTKPELPADAIAALAVATGFIADYDVAWTTAEGLMKGCAKP
jgi:hypothetical protein